MVKLDAYTEKLVYTSKYGAQQDTKDIPSDLLFLAPERFSKQPVLLHTAYAETEQGCQEALRNFITATKCTDTITNVIIEELND